MTLQASVAKRTFDNITVVVIAFNFMLGENSNYLRSSKKQKEEKKRQREKSEDLNARKK